MNQIEHTMTAQVQSLSAATEHGVDAKAGERHEAIHQKDQLAMSAATTTYEPPPTPTAPVLMTVEDYLNLEVAEADHRFHYGEDDEQFGELFLPTETTTVGGKKLPVVVFLHGGCWSPRFNLLPVSGMCRALAEKCRAAVWNLEYRRWGNGGGWPHTFVDAGNGLDILGNMADEFNLDLSNVVACGHSAGGQLALWLAARPGLAEEFSLYENDKPLALKSVVALAPVSDIERASEKGACGHAVSQLMGGPSAKVSEFYEEGSPIALLPLGVRHIIVNGMQDIVAPLGSVAPLVERALELGDDSCLLPINNSGHFELVTPNTMAGQMVMETIQHEIDYLTLCRSR